MKIKAAISITNNCNLRCKMCDIGQRKVGSGLSKNFMDRESIIPPEKWKEILDEIGATHVHIAAVEPLLYKELEKLLFFISPGRFIYLTTNGYLLNDKNIEILSKYCSLIAISIDGPSSDIHDEIRGVPGSFDRAFQGFLALKDKEVNLKISCAVQSDNVNHLIDMYDLFTINYKTPIIFNHYNYIHPASCHEGITPSNLIDSLKDIDTQALLIAANKGLSFSPELKSLKKLNDWYKKPPKKPVLKKNGCKVLNQMAAGQKYTMMPDGKFCIPGRCWVNWDFSNKLPKDDIKFHFMAAQFKTTGLPAACQRLCCSLSS